MAAWRIIIVLLSLAWCAAHNVAAAATAVGETIENQATLTYIDFASGTPVEILSNVSRLVVTARQQFKLTHSQNVSAFAGDSVPFVHELTNVGNVEDQYQLSAASALVDGSDFHNLVLYIDSNGNGEVDASEPVVDGLVTLQADESISLILTGVVPYSAVGNAEIEVQIVATSVGLQEIQTNTDVITVTPEADIAISLTNNPQCGMDISTDTPIEYRVVATNRTNALPVERNIELDGEQRSGVVLSLELPVDFTLVKEEFLEVLAFQAVPIVQLDPDDDQWRRYEHWTEDLPAARIALLIPAEDFNLGESVEFAFAARGQSVPEEEATFTLQAEIDLEGDGEAEFLSNTVCNHLFPPLPVIDAELTFIEPVLDLQREGQAPDFSNDENFADTPVYSLHRDSVENRNKELFIEYEFSRDGVYIELTADVSDDLLVYDANNTAYTIVDLVSLGTGDTLRVVVRETAEDARRYRSIRPILLSESEVGGGAFCPQSAGGPLLGEANYVNESDTCVLSSTIDDTLNINFNDPTNNHILFDAAVVDPTSVVFDSTSLEGVTDATVYLKQGDSAALHPITDQPIVFRTDGSGQFSLPRLLSGDNYHLFVEPPRTYSFPSAVAPARFPDLTVNEYSYGLNGFNGEQIATFSVARDDAPPVVDVPLDPIDTSALLVVEKRALIATAEPGDVVGYTADITNNSTGALSSLSVIDTPPFGFRYVPNSTTLAGVPIAEPTRVRISHDDGRVLSDNNTGNYINALMFELDNIAEGASLQLQYRLQVTPAALEGKGINSVIVSATSESGVVIASNPSRAQVSFQRKGVLSDDAIVFGKIYVDSTCDLIQNKGEWPIAGVRLYLQDGTYVTTDEDGQFSLYGLPPGAYVIRVDSTTMPAGVDLKPLDTRHAADPSSRFLNLVAGDFHRADFATGCPTINSAEFFTELKERNRSVRGDWLLDSAAKFDPDGAVRRTSERQRAAPDGDLSAGLIDSASGQKTSTIVQSNGDATNDTSSTPMATDVRMGNPQVLVKDITQSQAVSGTWLWPQTDISSDGRFMAVVRAGIDPVLYVNDVAVEGSKIGERIVNRRENAQIVAWYGVKLLPGANQVEIRGTDAFSNERVLASGNFKKPGSGVRLELSSTHDTVFADGGRSVLPITITVYDRHGYPANGVYFVTLDSTLGDFVESDLQLSEPGLQVRVENGRALVHLQSADSTGKLQVRAKAGKLSDTLSLVSIADLRPLFGVGLLELGGRYSTSTESADDRADLEDGFESDERIALFLKGRIRNNWHLTLSYDSEKSDDTDLLRNLNPNEHYPTFGDASVRGFEAQSRSKLYAKVERDRHSVMWGDYLTDNFADIDNLGRVQRTLTGANAVYDDGRTRLQVFAAEQSDFRDSEEIRGNGTALLFQIAGAPIVANSEVVERIVRHRDNPGLVVESQRLQRYVDYSIEHITGLLAFTDTVPSFDSDGNPVFIRVSYDREGNSDDYLISGVRLQNQFTQSTLAGVSLTDDQNPLSGYTLSSIYVKTRLGVNTVVVASQAAMRHRSDQNDGFASRLELTHQWGGRRDHRTSMTWARAGINFTNSNASVSSGREELRLTHRHSVSNTLNMDAEFLRSEAVAAGTGYTSAGVTFEKTYEDWSFRLGGRHLRSFSVTDDFRFNTVLFGLDRRFTFGEDKSGSFGFDIERDVSDANRFNYGFHSRIQLHEHVELYGRFERDRGIAARSLIDGRPESTLFTLGVESDVSPDTNVYSEYRMRSSFNGTSVESASGIRGRYQIKPGLMVSPALEVLDGISGLDAEDSIALSIGFSDTRNPNRKLNAQAEVRDTESNTYYGFRGTVAQRLNQDWTALVREEFTRQTPDTGQLTSRHRFTVGLARRPKLNNRHHGLYLFNWKEDYGPASGMDRTAYVLSTHQNRQINSNLTLSGRVGGKWQETRFDTGAVNSHVMLSDVRATLDLQRRWELDLRAGWLGTGQLSEGRYSYGLGLAWLVDRNTRLGLAYNFVGFRDEDLDSQAYNAQGVHLGLQLKFDEDWFRWLEEK